MAGAVSLSTMVAVPVGAVMKALVAFDRSTKKFSLPSNTMSSVMLTVIVLLVSPAAKFNVPLAPA
jgi:hypothetical protein